MKKDSSQISLKKSNIGIQRTKKHRDREISSHTDQIFFDLGIHDNEAV